MSVCASRTFNKSFVARAAFLLANVAVRLSNTAPAAGTALNVLTTTLCAEYTDSTPPNVTIVVQCAPSLQTFKYVIVQSMNTTPSAVCLTEVQVFSGERLTILFRSTSI